MFGSFWKSKEKKAIQCAEDLTNMFPNFLNIAKGWNGTNEVPDCIAHHPEILGFLYGFSFAVVSTASRKLRFDEETQYRIIYQAICNVLNRPDDFQEIGYRIIRLEDAKTEEFMEYMEDGKDLAIQLGVRAVSGTDRESHEEMEFLVKMLRGRVYRIMEENNILPINP
jgi:hypothetical protein